jgi:DNA-binding winged helix-turn-helix (wHTH) protein
MWESELYRFDGLELRGASRELLKAGESLRISPLSVAVLAELVRVAPRLIDHHQLARSIWCGARVEPGSTRQAIWEIRRTLKEATGVDRIQTLRGRGYRFLGAVMRMNDGVNVQAMPSAEHGGAEFCGVLTPN